ncbi:MAG: oxidative damage protection protein [Rhodocyclaceae bacterium]|jgi:Fe-S cluster biosynthesis and repair protein YggX|nr:oxidative damage protection protein [Rhodocyclaceae bacterium]
MPRTVNCVKLGYNAAGLDFPPLPGGLGQRIYENVSKEAWQQWLTRQTMIINENRLKLSEPDARKYLAEQVTEHFFGAGTQELPGWAPSTPPAKVRWTMSGLE